MQLTSGTEQVMEPVKSLVSQSKAALWYVPAVSTACCFPSQLLREGHAHFAHMLD